jgi:rhodanese-related sulfurtransferase
LRASLGWSAAELGRLLFESLHSKLLTLPDETLVYPAHGAGSLCGKTISTDAASTIGAERRSNYALRPMALEEFVAAVCADQPDAPPYFTYDAVQNASEHATLDSVLVRALTPLSLREVLDMQMAGTLVLDVRDGQRFAAGHLPGSINIGLTGRYATWAGTVLHHEDAIVVVADPGREEEAATRLARIGFDHVVGHLEGGIATAQARPCLLVRTARVSAAQLAERLTWPLRPVVLDVRTLREWNDQHIEGSVNIPLTRLCERLSELRRDRTLVVICASGYRSAIAASLLQRHGFDLVELAGGMQAWSAYEAAKTDDRATTTVQ